MTQHKWYDTRWFFGMMMIVLFVVSYLFWGVLFIGPSKTQGRLERGLHNTINTSNQQGGSRNMMPGMGGNRMNGGGQGGTTRAFNQGGQQQGSAR